MGQRPFHHWKFFLVILAEVVGLCILYRNNFFGLFLKEDIILGLPPPSPPRYIIKNGLFHLPLFDPFYMRHFYVEINKNTWCFTHGVNLSVSGKACSCLTGWYGADCGIPLCVHNSLSLSYAPAALHRRHRPRRLIYSLVISSSNPDLLLLRMNEYEHVIDVYLIGLAPSFPQHIFDNKPNVIKVLLPKASNFSDKLGFSTLQDQLWSIGLQNMTDFRPDDLVIITDERAIPSKELLLFLKLYSGYNDPLLVEFQHFLYNFRLKVNDDDAIHNSTEKMAVVTFNFFQQVCLFQPSSIYDGSYNNGPASSFFVKNNGPLSKWVLRSSNPPCGWVCHMCASPYNSSVSRNTSVLNTALKEDPTLDGTFPPVSLNFSLPSILFHDNQLSYLLGA